MSPEEFADKLFRGEKVELPSRMGKDLEWAKKACRILSNLMETKWGKVIGIKAGLTSEESRRKFEGGPIYGPLHEANVVEGVSLFEIPKSEFADPMVEVEVAVVDNNTYIAIEIPNNRYGRKWEELKAVDIQADLGGEGKLILLSPFSGEVDVRVNGNYVKVSDMAGKGWVYGWLKSINENARIYLLGTIISPIKLSKEVTVECCGNSITLRVV